MVATCFYIKHSVVSVVLLVLEMGSSFLKCIHIYYLCYKVSDEGDVGVELFQTLADVADHGQDVATAQQVDHPVQQSLLQLQLEGGGWGNQ